MEQLAGIDSPLIDTIRGSGLFVGIEIDPALGSAREVCERLMGRGLLSKETHENCRATGAAAGYYPGRNSTGQCNKLLKSCRRWTSFV